MPRQEDAHQCERCGARSPRWLGRCPACGAWDALRPVPTPLAAPAGPAPRFVPLPEVAVADLTRRTTGFAEFDRALGGGLVPGSVVLLAGEPGNGKSTLLLQTADRVAGGGRAAAVLSAEESASQVALRARRLGLHAPGLQLLAETDLARALEAVRPPLPDLLVVDSVQTLRDPEIPAPAGSPTQVRRVADAFALLARRSGLPVILVGQVTKDGAVAGPKLLEHLVDAVLLLEGDDRSVRRTLRAAKNRFGPADELGVFEMTDGGLREAADPSALLLAERAADTPGSAVGALLEGRRPLLVEIQALVVPSRAPLGRRTVVGLEPARVALAAAVLERWAGVPLAEAEIFVRVGGGLRLTDPAADLPLAVALLSAVSGRPVPPDRAFCGEIGLGGDLREPSGRALRHAEAVRLGLRAPVTPPARRDAADAPTPESPARVAELPKLLERIVRPAPAGAAAPAPLDDRDPAPTSRPVAR